MGALGPAREADDVPGLEPLGAAGVAQGRVAGEDEQPLLLADLVVVRGRPPGPGGSCVDADPRLLGAEQLAEPRHAGLEAVRVLGVELELGRGDVDPLHGVPTLAMRAYDRGPMRAAIQHEFGPPEVLAIEEVAVPRADPDRGPGPGPRRRGQPGRLQDPRRARAMAGVLGEPPVRLGWDVSGVVTAVGGGVTRFRVGDEVFGMPWFPRQAGAYAEYVTAPSRHFAAKPAGPLPRGGGGAAAGRADRLADRRRHDRAAGRRRPPDPRRRRRGRPPGGADRQGPRRQRLRHRPRRAGRAGCASSGSTRRSTTASERFEDLVADLDAVIDFTGTYGERSLPVLRPGGMLVSVPSGVRQELLELARARASRRATGFLVEPDPVGLAGLCHLVEDGQLQVKVDRVFDLEQAAAAHRLRRSAATAAARSCCGSPSRVTGRASPKLWPAGATARSSATASSRRCGAASGSRAAGRRLGGGARACRRLGPLQLRDLGRRAR